MSDFNNRAAIGQAINLAVQSAIALNKQQDLKFIFKEYLRFKQIADVIQRSNPQQLVEALADPQFNELLSKIEELSTKKALKD